MSIFRRRRTLSCALLAVGLLSATGLTSAQGRKKARPWCHFSMARGWSDDAPKREYITRKAGANDGSGVPQVVSRVQDVLSMRADFDIYIAEAENNAFAGVANGRKILVVDVQFLENVNKYAKTEWAAIQVIAHEVGHHIAGFSSNSHQNELNADYWSGQVLKRLGSAKSAATNGILALGADFDSSSHPNKRRRAEIIARGWEDAATNKIDYSYCNNCR